MQQSVWEKDSFFAPVDILIAGAGFTGLWSAYHLKKSNPELNILVVERGTIPVGASSRNAGFACFGSLTELIEDAEKYGIDEMLRLVEMRYRGIEQIKMLASRYNFDISLNGGYELISHDPKFHAQTIPDSIRWMNNHLAAFLQNKNCFQLADKLISNFGFHQVDHLILNAMEGTLHPGKLLQALIREVTSMGVVILNSLNVISYNHNDNGIAVQVNGICDILAANLLICTNAFTKELIPDIDITPARGQVIAVRPEKNPQFNGSFHFDRGFYYFRNLGDKIILGGARNLNFGEENTLEFGTTDIIQNHLQEFLTERIIPGQRFEITERWSGIMAMGTTKSPIISRIEKNVYAAVRMSGMGVALAPVAGEMIAGMICPKK